MDSAQTHLKTNRATEEVTKAAVSQYMPHIDGIRAIAVLAVVLYHLNPSWCPGGFIGVDVFFVISGYLITRVILRDLRDKKFSLANFYHRRCRRILPAYTVVVGVVLAVGMLLFPSSSLVSLGTTALYSTLFSTNIFFRYHSGYFDSSVQQNPLLHLWSLGVEEHFYLVVPVILAAIWKARPRAVKLSIAAILLLSLTFSEIAIINQHERSAFYFFHLRAWELLAGALLATCKPINYVKSVSHQLLSLMGFILIGASYYFLNEHSKFPGLSAAPAVLGTVLLIRFGFKGEKWNILTIPPLVAIGKISYSLYLWHWPVIVFWTYCCYGIRDWKDIIGMSILSAVLAWGSWKYVENPVRHNSNWTPRTSLRFTLLSGILLITICFTILVTHGFQGRLHPKADSIMISQQAKKVFSLVALANPVFKLQADIRKNLPNWMFGIRTPGPIPNVTPTRAKLLGDANTSPSFLLCGDSHALMLHAAIDLHANQSGISGYYIPQARLFSNTKILDKTDIDHCRETDLILDWLAKNPSIKTVILACRWPLYTSGEMPICRRIGNITLTGGFVQVLQNALSETSRRMKKHGIEFVILSCVAEMPCSVSEMMARGEILPWRNPWHMICAKDEYEVRQADINNILSELQNQDLLRSIPMHNAFLRDNIYISTEKSHIFYSDNNHLTSSGAKIATEYVAPLIWKK